MKQFEVTKTTINKDVNNVFSEIMEEVKNNYFSASNSDLTRIKDNLSRNLPRTIGSKSLLLLDTVLNYLSDDAVKILGKADNKTINEFYENHQKWMENLKTEFRGEMLNNNSINLSLDARVMYAGSSGVIAGGLAGLVAKTIWLGWIPFIIAATAVGTLASGVVYQQSSTLALNKIEEDIEQYISESKTITLQKLEKVIESYKRHFAGFLQENNLT